MKPNIFQKIVSLLYLTLLLVICVFYVPFRYGRLTNYDTIWSNNSNIDLYRISIYLILLSTIFYFLYKYLERMNDLEESQYKKLAKKELKILLIFFIGFIFIVTTLFAINGINRLRWHSLTDNIKKAKSQITDTEESKKIIIRNEFWNESLNTFNLKEFDNNINKYWDYLLKRKENYSWLSSFYDELHYNNCNLEKFGITSSYNLKSFIENNILTDEDIKKEENNEVLNNYILDINKKNNLTFFEIPEIRMISIISLAILFGFFYVLRPLTLFIYKMFRDAS